MGEEAGAAHREGARADRRDRRRGIHQPVQQPLELGARIRGRIFPHVAAGQDEEPDLFGEHRAERAIRLHHEPAHRAHDAGAEARRRHLESRRAAQLRDRERGLPVGETLEDEQVDGRLHSVSRILSSTTPKTIIQSGSR